MYPLYVYAINTQTASSLWAPSSLKVPSLHQPVAGLGPHNNVYNSPFTPPVLYSQVYGQAPRDNRRHIGNPQDATSPTYHIYTGNSNFFPFITLYRVIQISKHRPRHDTTTGEVASVVDSLCPIDVKEITIQRRLHEPRKYSDRIRIPIHEIPE